MKNLETEAAWAYHNGTKHSYESVRMNRHYLDWDNQPIPFKIYSELGPISLPEHLSSSGVPALSAISGSVAGHDSVLPARQTLVEILFLCAGITRRRSYAGGEMLFRAAACTGALYHVDMRLRPSGRSGPVATKLGSFRDYQMSEAWTWEHMALTRARVVSAEPDFRDKVEGLIRSVLAQPREARTIAFDVEGLRINLGSIGKGYAIDRAAAVIRSHWFPTSALIHGGQSSLFALGSPPGRFAGRWEVSLRNPFVPESPLGVFRLRNRALGTSGGAFQRFEVDGRSYGHILDPRTGEPADGPASVTVLAPTSAEAENCPLVRP